MAPILGKRKRLDRLNQQKPSKTSKCEESSASASEDEEQMKAIFQRHFEAQFKPLEKREENPERIESSEDEDEEENEDSGWEGFSSDKEEKEVQIIEHNDARADDAIASKRELKAFLSGKVPNTSNTISTQPAATVARDNNAGDEDDKVNLKNDLALQRLLRESHLLDPSHKSSSLDPTGKNRLRALDIRMQSLGASGSVFDGGKMPMSMRKGITSYRKSAEDKRRRDARENGIILEKEKREKKVEKKRERGVGGPSVGRYKSGMLVLSKQDIRNIEGPKEGRSGKKRGRR